MEREAFVARDRELRQLDGFLHRALAGQGAVCFVTGEAGSGKTALVAEFARRVEETHADLVIAIGGCNAQTGIGDPYLPFREVLGLLTGDVEAKLAQGTITQKTAGRLRDFLRISGQTLVEIGPDLIGIFVPGAKLAVRAATFAADKAGWLERLEKLEERRAVVAGGPRLDQSRIFEQYTDVLLALAAQRPLMLVLDDLHWADASSISLLFHLGRRIGESRVLMLGTYRPEDVAQGREGERHPLEGVVSEFKRYLGDVCVDVGQAEGSEGQRFVDALLDMEANRLDESFRQELLRRTGGNALFTTELLRDMQERGTLVRDQGGRWVEGPALDWDALPARVEGVIEKRIGWLEAEAREALTVASVEGEEFTAEVVARVQAVDERGLVRQLSGELEKQHHLVSAQGIRRLGAQRLSLYRFRHNLFQKYLYGSLDEVERVYLHEDVGNVLEALYGTQAGEISVQLARHFQEAGIEERAIDYLQQAANRAVRLSANREAVAHLTKALELLVTLPDTPERAQQELTLQITLGQALVATKGYGALEAEQAFARARTLCESMGQTIRIFPVLRGLWNHYILRAELKTAQGLAEQLLELAQGMQDRGGLMNAHLALGDTLLCRGELSGALEHLEQSIALYDPRQDHSLAFVYGQDPAVAALSHGVRALWMAGYPDQALRSCREKLLPLAQELSHPHSLAFALGFATVLHHLRREMQATQEMAEATIALSTEHGFPHWLAQGAIYRGWALAEQGQREEGTAQMRQGLAAWRVAGAELGRPYYLALLAGAHGEEGQAEAGLAVLAEALDTVKETGECNYEAELHRLRGELLLIMGAAEAEIEACFRRAIEVACQQDAKSWELRATMSLCRLWQKQGKDEEARQILAEIYGWFSEGFDTPDLKEAKALLEELS